MFIIVIFSPTKVFSAGIVPDCGTVYACNFCDLVLLVSNIINFIIYMSVSVSAIMFTYAGFLYIMAQGQPGKISTAHGIFKNVALGLFFILGAWLLVNAITSSLLGGDFTDILNKNYSCTKTLLNTTSETSVQQSSGSTTTTTTTEPSSGENALEAEARLEENSIDIVSSGNCSDKSLSTCTSLEGIQTSTLDGIINLANNCQTNDANCKVTVTGGTETGHSTAHSDGKKIDLSKNDSTFNNFMETVVSGNQGESISEGTKYSNVEYNNTTYTIIDEGDHWDIEVMTI